MPELPEVEALAVFLREHASGRVIARAETASFAVLKTFDPPLSALSGREITEISRHGKFLDLRCADGSDAAGSGPAGSGPGDLHLVMHLARAGWLRWRTDIPDKPLKLGKSPLAFRLVLEDGTGFDLTEAGTQKRLAVYLVRDPADVPGVATLGPEPLADDFTVDALAAILAGRRTQIKGVLRDQHIIAGIGNAYSDEVLHVAKMSPFKLASSFTPEEVAVLHEAIVTTLTEAVKRSAGLAAADLKGEKKTGLRVHGKTGQPCSVCGDTIREVSFADSSLQYCPTCQTGGKPLADRRLSRLLKLADEVAAAQVGSGAGWLRRASSGGAADRLAAADEVNVGGRHPAGDPGLELDLGQRGGHQFPAVRALRQTPRGVALVDRFRDRARLGAARVGEPGEVDVQRDARLLHGQPGLRGERVDDVALGGFVEFAPPGGRFLVPSARHRRREEVADAWRFQPCHCGHASPPCMNSRRQTVWMMRSTQPERPLPVAGPGWPDAPSPQTTPTNAPLCCCALGS
jgi:formamidopyrimidine-DNA glycosylase